MTSHNDPNFVIGGPKTRAYLDRVQPTDVEAIRKLLATATGTEPAKVYIGAAQRILALLADREAYRKRVRSWLYLPPMKIGAEKYLGCRLCRGGWWQGQLEAHADGCPAAEVEG